jgi:hypothetical protein
VSRLRRHLADERGTSLAELMVGLAAGTVVMLGLTTLVVITLHTTTKVSARVDATQRARTALTRMIDQLHSACIAPKAAPMRKESTGSELRFVHAAGSAVAPVPTLSVISLSGTTLSQTDYSWKEGSAPFWVFNTTPASTTELMTNVVPITGKPLFSYYAYGSGALSETALPTPLSELDASRTIQVGVAFQVGSGKKGYEEEATPARIQDSATFRLTASSYNKEAASLPCQ